MSVDLIHTTIGMIYLALWLIIGHTSGRRREWARSPKAAEPLF
jgi:hypothetical protein